MGNAEMNVIVEEIKVLKSEFIDIKIEVAKLNSTIKSLREEVNKKDKEISNLNLELESHKKKDVSNEVEKNNFEVIEEEKTIKVEKIESKVERYKNSNKKLKIALKKYMKSKVSELSYETWLDMGVSNLKCNGNEYIFLVPNDFTKEIIEKRYKDLIEVSLKKANKKVDKIEVVVGNQDIALEIG